MRYDVTHIPGADRNKTSSSMKMDSRPNKTTTLNKTIINKKGHLLCITYLCRLG